MGETRVTGIVVHSTLARTDDERDAGIVYTAEGGLSEPELIDTEIEDRERRRRLAATAGNISITVVPGSELGQVSINVQFEGKHGKYDLCLENQGELFTEASGWLSELLAELGADYDVRIEARPCPNTDKRLPLKHAAEIIERVSERARSRATTGARVEHGARHTVE